MRLHVGINYNLSIKLGQKIYSFVAGAPGIENESHAGGRKNIFFEQVYRKMSSKIRYVIFLGQNRADGH